MTLPRLDAMVEQWERVPPLSVSVAAIAAVLGVGRQKPAAPRRSPTGAPEIRPQRPAPRGGGAGAMSEEQAGELMAMLGAAGFSQGKPQWLNATTK